MIVSVASIWFEIWGSWIRVKKVRFLLTNFRKISIFSGNFTKKSIFHEKNGHLQQLLGKLFYFSSKVTTYEHTSCTWYFTTRPRPPHDLACQEPGGCVI